MPAFFCSRRRLAPVCGGAEGDRTPDPRVANAMLSQLSYSPATDLRPHGTSLRQDSRSTRSSGLRPGRTPEYAVGLDRVELSTSRLSGVRSNHLSYRPGRSRPLQICLRSPEGLFGFESLLPTRSGRELTP